VADGRAVFDYQSGKQAFLTARDAWNGVPLWTIPRPTSGAHRRWQLVATGGRIYTFFDGRLVALDAATGEIALRFEKAAGSVFPEEGTQLRVGSKALLVNLQDGLHALDPRTGELLWSYREADRALAFPALAEDVGLAFAAVVDPAQRLRSRWPSALADAVVCLDLRSGRVVWRTTEVAGKPIGQLIHGDGLLGLFAGSAIGGRQKEGGWVSAIRVADGKLQGQGTFASAYNDSMYNALLRDVALWYAGHTSLYRFEPGPGRVTRMTNLSYNQRCNRFTATPGLWLLGYITYLDKEFNGTLQTPARAGCALGTTPANGMVYLTPSACNCFTQLRGYQALSPEPLRAAVEGKEGAAPPDATRATASPAGPIPDDWSRGLARKETEPVEVDGLQLVSVIHEHRVEARRGTSVVWSSTAGGRVSGAPLVREGRIYYGSHDGWVYALSAADGARLWRSRVAPYERKTVAYGQLESSWPVFGVAWHEGKVVASAGTHPELGGGVFVRAFDPATGDTAWRRTLSKPHAAITTVDGKSTGKIVPNSFLNEAPVSEAGRVRIGAFSFDPAESDQDIRERLATPPVKKR
jgi:outer membrane protein assembly factor BamB